MDRIRVGLLTPQPLLPREQGRELLELLAASPRFAPDFYNDVEPVNRLFDPSRIDEALELWGSVWVWRKRKPRVLGIAFPAAGDVHSAVFMEMGEKAFWRDEVEAWFAAASSKFVVDLAYVHVRTRAALENVDYFQRHTSPLSDGLFTHSLVNGMPDLPWLTYFGPPYVELLAERLLDAPAYRTERLGEGVILQLTRNVLDPEPDRERF